ncbi:Peptidoglycan-N-acetylglucosamine deacetylase [Leucoagaricus sp. SymC.cos]|nr:Peptidoglycan-N-acetylglucosamine deacetylase [Leucoagaricus sp. SymC.cos]
MLFNKLAVLASAVLASVSSVAAAPSRRALAQVVTQCTVPGTVALTFDDGPYYYIYDISKTLVAHNATGTFFFSTYFHGNNYGCIYDEDNVKRVNYVLSKGHQIGSHTWSHKDLTTLTWDQIHDEMWRVEEAFLKITGHYPAFMRPPYGSYNDEVREASAIRGQALALWDFDTEDSLGASVAQQKASIDALIKKHPKTILSLEHETYVTTMTEVVPYFVQKLQAAGYRLVSLSECTGLPAYQSISNPQARDVVDIPTSISSDSSDSANVQPVLEFDPEWLAITRAFHPLFSTQHHQPAFPEENEAREAVAKALQWVVENLQKGDPPRALPISNIQTFVQTAPAPISPSPSQRVNENEPQPPAYSNPQTEAFCRMLSIKNKINPGASSETSV